MHDDQDKTLFKAAEDGDLSNIKKILAKDNNVDAQNYRGDTALFYAVCYGQINAIELLISYGANVNTKNLGEETPLFYAAKNGDLEIVELLLAHGANVDGKPERNGWSCTPLHLAARRGHTQVVQTLLAKGADVNAYDYISYYTPLMYAAKEGHKQVVEVLLAHGADVNKGEIRPNPNLPADQHEVLSLCIAAVAQGNMEKTSLDNSALVKTTALDLATQKGHMEIANILKKHTSKGCFIATACYGNPDYPEVLVLRHFRDKYLLPYPIGSSFIAAYYRISPPIAAIIQDRPLLRVFVKTWIIYPVIWFVSRYVKHKEILQK